MKKFLLLVVVLFAGTSLFAQDVQFGAKGGLNFANFSGDDADGDTKTDIFIGGFARISLTETLAFQPELVYSRQGSKAEENGIDAKFKANYLNLPLLLRAEMFGCEKFHGIIGPQVGIHLNSEYEEEDGDLSASIDMNDEMKGLALALALGFEYDITEKIAVGLRYNLGLSKIADNDADIRNSVFQLGVSVAF
jgi:OmpA-like transmembrane domain.